MIEDVIKNVRESFLNEGVDEQVLHELKQVSVTLVKPDTLIRAIWPDVIAFCLLYRPVQQKWRRLITKFSAREVRQS